MRCERCGKKADCITMSYFNRDMICAECEKKEKKHPDYKKAKEIENEAVRKPDDL
jgi:hypothetical protein